MMNGKCGYVLRPKFMFHEGYNPYDANSPGLDPNDATLIGVRVLAARYKMLLYVKKISNYLEQRSQKRGPREGPILPSSIRKNEGILLLSGI